MVDAGHLGFRQFLLLGLAKVNRGWRFICVGHNLLKLFRYGAGRLIRPRTPLLPPPRLIVSFKADISN